MQWAGGSSPSGRTNMWWLWRRWLARQIVALEAVGSSPTRHPTLQGKRTRKSSLFSINKLGCRQAVRHGTLTPACVGSNPANPTTPPQAVHRLRRLFLQKSRWCAHLRRGTFSPRNFACANFRWGPAWAMAGGNIDFDRSVQTPAGSHRGLHL